MRNGYVNHKVIKCLIIGAAGVGKTTIKNLLLNKEPPKKRISTGVMGNPVRAVSVSRIAMTKDSWFVVDDDKKLMKIIADVIKDGAVPRDDTNFSVQPNVQYRDSTLKSVEYTTDNGSTVHGQFIDTIDKAKGMLHVQNNINE